MHESFAGKQFYHGTVAHSADGILAEGARVNSGSYGQGFYLADDEHMASVFGHRHGQDSVVLKGRLLSDNLKHFDSVEEAAEYRDKHGYGDDGAPAMSELLRSQGYDAMTIRYNPMQPHKLIAVAFQHGGFQPQAMRSTHAKKEPWTDLT